MIVILSGTSRPGSRTRCIVRELEEAYAALGVPHEVLDLARLPLDAFLPGAYAEKPASFAPFADTVQRAGGVHVVTPEYNGGMPGVLKHFIDLLKFPESFEGRPVAFTGVAAGMWGALRPVEQLQAIFAYRSAHVFPDRVFLPRIHELLDDAGRLKDAELRHRLHAQAAGFAEFVRKLRA
ncbi:MAG: NADPH-dependent FMN reductase [Limisphaerales bacterium]